VEEERLSPLLYLSASPPLLSDSGSSWAGRQAEKES